MWVVITHDITDDTRRFVVTLIWPVTSIKHRVENTAVNWF